MILQLENVSKVVPSADGELVLLDHLSFSIDKGESIAIVGRSGSGKSTLLGLMAGLDHASSGSINFAGQRLESLDEEALALLRAKHVGFVFQSFQLLQSLTALENVMLPLELAGGSNAENQAKQWLEKVGLGHRIEHYPSKLSGGEQQRVAVARAFAAKPAVLFADEPTGSLDAATGEQVADLLFDLNREVGTTLVLVTHDQQLADRCGRQIRIEAGKIVTEATA
ncbi:putative ABC transport system ATP-binding protein [Umboniibacter marinipuniceus]|uniref:Putative ABC transport system ATP-binding protein n=1 Tax=Umboniibacter marinipuniceus TaxID=569599 RepID=A0A3M0A200_9GAMM|nr:putative ABC transport system ATP-binding protein [Umboniibacter marinipuniceus]